MVMRLTSTQVDLSTLKTGQYELDYELDSDYLAGQEATELLGGHIKATARLDLRERDFDLYIEEKGEVQVACDRCLEPVSIAVENGEMIDIDEDESDEQQPSGKTLDLQWLAYEMIIVNLPLVHSHPEGECNPQMQDLLQAHLCSTLPEAPEDN